MIIGRIQWAAMQHGFQHATRRTNPTKTLNLALRSIICLHTFTNSKAGSYYKCRTGEKGTRHTHVNLLSPPGAPTRVGTSSLTSHVADATFSSSRPPKRRIHHSSSLSP